MKQWGMIALGLALGVTSVFGFASAMAADKPGSADHPLLARYPGFEIRDQATVEYDEADIILGPLIQNDDGSKTLALQRLEGKVHNTLYFQDGKATSQLQMFRNYENALQKLGAEILYSCMRQECFELNSEGNGTFLQVHLTDNGRVYNGIQNDIAAETGILTARLSQGDKRYHIQLAVSADDINEDRFVNQSIIESAGMDIEKVAIGSADDIERMINATGKAVLDGIYFDHDEATIKAESETTLSAIAAYLKQNGNRRFFVVGHTDGSGAYDYNVKLSTERAAAVVSSLLTTGVKESQLRSIGVGPVAPAESNNNDAGLANNRRVELVEDIGS